MLLHGGGASTAIWYRQIRQLSLTRRVLASGSPVLGLSSQPIIGRPLHAFARDYLIAFLDAFGVDTADIAGLSLGGSAALGVAADYPQRLRRLAILDSAGLGRDLPIILCFMSVPYVGRLFARPGTALLDLAFETLEVEYPDRPDSEVLKQYTYDVTLNHGHARAKQAAARRFASVRGQSKVFSDAELRRIQAPTLII